MNLPTFKGISGQCAPVQLFSLSELAFFRAHHREVIETHSQKFFISVAMFFTDFQCAKECRLRKFMVAFRPE